MTPQERKELFQEAVKKDTSIVLARFSMEPRRGLHFTGHIKSNRTSDARKYEIEDMLNNPEEYVACRARDISGAEKIMAARLSGSAQWNENYRASYGDADGWPENLA